MVLTGAAELDVHLTEEAVDVLVNKTDGRPYSILFTLQQAQTSEQLSEDQVNKMLEQTDEEAWDNNVEILLYHYRWQNIF